jgi:hypothetical protein
VRLESKLGITVDDEPITWNGTLPIVETVAFFFVFKSKDAKIDVYGELSIAQLSHFFVFSKDFVKNDP